MTKLTKGARKHLLKHIYDEITFRYHNTGKVAWYRDLESVVAYSPVWNGYIGNHRKHNRAPVAIEHTVGLYKTARQRNRM